MGLAYILQCISTSFSMGLGCGTCCGTSVSVYLSTYIVTHAKNIKKSAIAFLFFFIGKLAAIMLLCVTASIAGKLLINKDGRIGNINVRTLMQAGLIVLGVILIVRWFIEFFHDSKCKNCSHDVLSQDETQKFKRWPAIAIGFFYGVTPCAPMLIIMGYSAVTNIFGAGLIALSFAIASSLSPLLLIVLLAGILSGKMYEEIPKYVRYLKLSCYILFIALAVFMI